MRKLISYFIFVILNCFANQTSAQSQLDQIIYSYESYLDEIKESAEVTWPEISEKTHKLRLERFLGLSEALKKVDVDSLDKQERISHEFLQIIFDNEIALIENEAHLMPLNAEGGFITSMSYATRNLNLDTQEKIDDYIHKLKDIPRYLDDQITNLKTGLAEKKTMPKLIVKNCLSVLRDAAGENADFLLRPFYQKEYDKETQDELLKLKTTTLIPWLKKLEAFLEEEYLPKTYDHVGIHNNKDGKAFYEQRVKYFTTLDITPQEVYDIGIAEVERIKKEMLSIIEELEFEGSFADFIEFLRTDEQFYAQSPEQLLDRASWLSMKAQEILPRYFNKLPRLPFTVNPVPDEIAPTYTTGRYSRGSMKRGRAGQYWVNTYNLPARPLYVIPSLTLHEAVPGHHLQISLAQEIEDLPSFRTRHYLSAYGEGWGLYSEFLGKEAGMYTTPYEDFGRLTYEMWRACRLVVDPGIHYMGMTRQEAIDFMTDNTSLSIHEINTEIDRYIGWPGQAVSYKIGEIKIRELRKRAEKSLEDFDIKEFHNLLLENGSIPLLTMERLVDEYIKDRS